MSEAIAALEQAIALNPNYADLGLSHYANELRHL
ncbi:MAG: hypothetical protein F6J93_30170 [Oscillatoria sp. SIO1A7]|nr:hypothetical protein [Oscillatoria sp. SIO1A7]